MEKKAFPLYIVQVSNSYLCYFCKLILFNYIYCNEFEMGREIKIRKSNFLYIL